MIDDVLEQTHQITPEKFQEQTFRFMEVLHRRTLMRFSNSDPILSQLKLPYRATVCPAPPPKRPGDEQIISTAFDILHRSGSNTSSVVFIEVGAGMSLDPEPGAYRAPWLARALRASQRKFFPNVALRIVVTDQDAQAQVAGWEKELFNIESSALNLLIPLAPNHPLLGVGDLVFGRFLGCMSSQRANEEFGAAASLVKPSSGKLILNYEALYDPGGT